VYKCIQILETGNFEMMLVNSLGQVGLGFLGATFGVILAHSLPLSGLLLKAGNVD
jgi:hypothetical protein